MTDKTELQTSNVEADVTTGSDAGDRRRALIRKLAAGAFAAPVILSSISAKATPLSGA